MTDEAYAVSANGYRVVTADMPMLEGEERMSKVPETVLVRIKSDQMRAERGHRLRLTDWTQMPDAPLTGAEKSAYQVYRQDLRDMPGLPGFPDVAWPKAPGLKDGAANAGDPLITA
ncbi:tail fiber assembly protein [Stenotrophomonas maltophilia]|uniref:tail fiber assembly protein n=1 Tax=Stenotrophomonas maltophilia TaxID=40324 RepID=UPI0013DC7A52|nr:tail fiber assembly protein [Stenotrophomonas maltophilia]